MGETLIRSLCDRLFDGAGLTGGIQRPAFQKSDHLSILRILSRPCVIITIQRRPINGMRVSHAANGYDHSTMKSFRASLKGTLSPSICKTDSSAMTTSTPSTTAIASALHSNSNLHWNSNALPSISQIKLIHSTSTFSRQGQKIAQAYKHGRVRGI